MGYERGDRRYGRDQSYGYRPRGGPSDRERGYERGEDLSYNRDRGYGNGRYREGRVDYGRPPRDYDYDDRGFLDRAGDEVRSWFGDEEAERRRRWDERNAQREYARNGGRDDLYGRETSGAYLAADPVGTGLPSAGYGWNFREREPREGQRGGGRHDHDPHYREWRDRQIEALDSDYADYRRENQSRFESDFGSWRGKREGQRQTLRNAREHQEVVGSDDQHIGTVDKVKGDRILLTRTDSNAGGHHHSIPCSWIESVEDKVKINRTAEQAKAAWRDEDQNSALGRDRADSSDGPHILNRSFSGTY